MFLKISLSRSKMEWVSFRIQGHFFRRSLVRSWQARQNKIVIITNLWEKAQLLLSRSSIVREGRRDETNEGKSNEESRHGRVEERKWLWFDSTVSSSFFFLYPADGIDAFRGSTSNGNCVKYPCQRALVIPPCLSSVRVNKEGEIRESELGNELWTPDLEPKKD